MSRPFRLLALLLLTVGFAVEAMPWHVHSIVDPPHGATTKPGCGEERSSLHFHAGAEVTHDGCSVAPLLAGLSLVPPSATPAPAESDAARVSSDVTIRRAGPALRRAPARAPPTASA